MKFSLVDLRRSSPYPVGENILFLEEERGPFLFFSLCKNFEAE